MGMINKEVVVFQIEDMLSNINIENLLTNGGYIENGTAFLELMTNVLTVLKEQKAKLVLNIADSIAGMEAGDCPGCGRYLVNRISDPSKFCKYCGQAVKWE